IMLKDNFGRIHDYLRISLTDKCNLRCTYCNPVDLPKGFFDGCTRMSSDEIESIAAIFVREGVKKIRLTGGEPLVRKDAREIIERLSKYPVELAITTNGVFVHEFIETFKKAGIRSVNVSLDSLKREVNLGITGRDEFERVKQNINLLLQHNFHVKVNVVVIRNVNDTEVADFAAWTKNQPLHVRFIEFMPFDGNAWENRKVVTQQEILDAIAERFTFTKLTGEKNDTAKKYYIPGHKGTFAIISSMSLPFCSGCNRMRLTTDGKMKNCLFSRNETDILTALRRGDDITALIKECLAGKEEFRGGQFSAIYEQTDASKINNRTMIKIGG
ncbi:MAG TPA: GTP 3',8-cyclase MoaA, partial [Chitinophagaceae bacterium]|nr:GTP 3',8-cyclase MoaA [Chitinophagaceae bacterium]